MNAARQRRWIKAVVDLKNFRIGAGNQVAVYGERVAPGTDSSIPGPIKIDAISHHLDTGLSRIPEYQPQPHRYL